MSTASSAWHIQSWRNGLAAASAVVMEGTILTCSPFLYRLLSRSSHSSHPGTRDTRLSSEMSKPGG